VKGVIDLRTATSLALIALGAILAFAVKGHPSWLNIQVVGWVIMLTGATGLLVPNNGYAAVRRRIVRRRVDQSGPVTEVHERRYPPYIKLNPASLTASEDPGDLVASQQQNAAERDEIIDEYSES
jgi:hypothetical protein